MDRGVLHVNSSISTGTKRTKPIISGWRLALYDHSNRNVQESRLKTANIVAELLKTSWINKFLLQNRQQSVTNVPTALQANTVFCWYLFGCRSACVTRLISLNDCMSVLFHPEVVSSVFICATPWKSNSEEPDKFFVLKRNRIRMAVQATSSALL